MGIRHAKAPNPSRLSKTWQSLKHPKNSSILSKPDRAHICTISGAIQLEYFSEDYDEEREMKPRPERTREVTPPLCTRSPRVRRQRERVVGFEEALNKEGSRTRRNTEGNRPSKAEAEEIGRWEMILPSLLASHLGRNENGQPLQSSLTSVHGGHQSLINIGWNLPPSGTLLLLHAQPFIPSSAHVPNGFVTTHANTYSQPSAGIINGHTLSFPFQAQTGNPSIGGSSVYPSQGGKKAGSILNYEYLKAKLRSDFSQQKRFTKTHLAVHDIKQREGKSVRAFAARTRNLVEHLFIDLSSTYKGLMEKTYTWIEAREVATNEAPNDRRDNFKRSWKSSEDNGRGQKSRDRFSPYRGPNHGLLSNLTKSPREILAIEKIEEAVKLGQLSHLVIGIKKERAKTFDSQRGEKKEKSTTPAEAPILMINQEEACTRNIISKSPTF
ncbi:hypothetical protein Tco_0168662 [Tanacetum coccineum]